jgi:hypothetical protein
MPEIGSMGRHRLLSAALSPLGMHRSGNEAIMLLDIGRGAWNTIAFNLNIDHQKKVVREVSMTPGNGSFMRVAAEYDANSEAYIVTLSLSEGMVFEVMAFIRANEALYRRNPGLYKSILDWWQHLWDGGKHEYGT